jgi:hypothetical protein
MPYKNPEDQKLCLDKWRIDNVDRCKKHARRGAIKRNVTTAEIRSKVFSKYGNKCVKCGFDDTRALQIDHVNGDGGTDKKIRNRRIYYYTKVLEDTTGKYQLLCCNCNWIKRVENNEVNYSGISVVDNN